MPYVYITQINSQTLSSTKCLRAYRAGSGLRVLRALFKSVVPVVPGRVGRVTNSASRSVQNEINSRVGGKRWTRRREVWTRQREVLDATAGRLEASAGIFGRVGGKWGSTNPR